MGEQFLAGILKRAGQSTLVVREVLFLLTPAATIENEKAEAPRESLITFMNFLQIPTPVCVHVDEVFNHYQNVLYLMNLV